MKPNVHRTMSSFFAEVDQGRIGVPTGMHEPYNPTGFKFYRPSLNIQAPVFDFGTQIEQSKTFEEWEPLVAEIKEGAQIPIVLPYPECFFVFHHENLYLKEDYDMVVHLRQRAEDIEGTTYAPVGQGNFLWMRDSNNTYYNTDGPSAVPLPLPGVTEAIRTRQIRAALVCYTRVVVGAGLLNLPKAFMERNEVPVAFPKAAVLGKATRPIPPVCVIRFNAGH
jgi:hypothetical protein